jgi:hypothetical protein
MKVKGLVDTIAQPLYDTVAIPAAGSTRLTFFAIPLGQGTTALGGAAAKHLGDTNMDLAGQLPSGFAFQIQGFRLAMLWNASNVDAQIALNAAAFRFFVGAKEFLRVPARTIPAGNGPFISGTGVAAVTQTAFNSGWPSMQNGFSIGRKPVTLGPTENFSITLEWQGGAQALAVAMPITIYIDGYLGRPVQ